MSRVTPVLVWLMMMTKFPRLPIAAVVVAAFGMMRKRKNGKPSF